MYTCASMLLSEFVYVCKQKISVIERLILQHTLISITNLFLFQKFHLPTNTVHNSGIINMAKMILAELCFLEVPTICL